MTRRTTPSSLMVFATMNTTSSGSIRISEHDGHFNRRMTPLACPRGRQRHNPLVVLPPGNRNISGCLAVRSDIDGKGIVRAHDLAREMADASPSKAG